MNSPRSCTRSLRNHRSRCAAVTRGFLAISKRSYSKRWRKTRAIGLRQPMKWPKSCADSAKAGRSGRALPGYERLWRWCKRNPGLASLNALAAGLTITLALAATLAAYTYRSQRNKLDVEQYKTRINLQLAEQAEKDLRKQLELTRNAERIARSEERRANIALANSLMNEGVALQRGGMIGQRFHSLDRLTNAARSSATFPRARPHPAHSRPCDRCDGARRPAYHIEAHA